MRHLQLEKQNHGGQISGSSSQNDHSSKTAEKLSAQYKVSPKTIQHDAEYASDINKIAAVAGTQGSRIIVETEGKLGRKEVMALAELSQANPEATKKVLHTLDGIDKPKVAKTIVQKAVEDIAEHGARWQEKTSHPGKQPEWLVSRVFMMMDMIGMSALATYRSREQRT